MKKIILFILLILVVAAPGWAIDLDLSASYRMVFFSDDSLEQGQGIQIRAGHKSLYLWGSYDYTQMRLYGQRAGNIDLYGIGGGLRFRLIDGLFITGEAGYFYSRSSMAKNPQKFEEVLGFVIGGYLDDIGYPPESKHYYTIYDYGLRGNWGGALGLDFSHPLYKNLSFNLATEYRFLKLPETFKGINTSISWVEFKGDRNFSGASVGIGVTYRF